jgi:tetratricopeptide (TPR) repeat protein
MTNSTSSVYLRRWLAACVVVLVGCLFAHTGWAQDFKRQYKHAKELFEEKKYNLAMEAFKPLIVYDRANPYPEYASFYYALSAYHQGYLAVAKDMLLQMRKLYPQWPQINEANVWLAKLYFDQREYFQALLILREVSDAGMQADVAQMKRHYLAQIDDAETLRMALENYPTDAEIARALARVLARDANQPTVLQQFDSLVRTFQLNRDEFNINQGPVSTKKDRYVVSLLFPFLASTLEPTPTTKVNQQILDLYQGMRLALDTLAQRGMPIDLRLYDTERSPDKLKQILEAEELKDTDVIVGPIFTDVKLVQEFSQAHQIVMISPGNQMEYVGTNPFALLFQPNFQTMGRRAAELVAEQVRNKNCLVFFGDTPKDSIQAFAFMQRARELGINIVLAEEHRKETAASIITLLTTGTEFDEFKNATQFTVRKDSIGSIYVATDDPLIYSKVNTSVTNRGDSVLVLGNESWIAPENTSTSYENFERNRVTLAAPRFFSEHSSRFAAFRKAYLATHGVYPTPQAVAGFEFMLWVGKALHQHGSYFVPGLQTTGFQPGAIYQGFDYTGSQDNQYVPFVRFVGGQLVVVNPRK